MLSLAYIYLDFISWRQRKQVVMQMFRHMCETSRHASALLLRNRVGSCTEDFTRNTFNVNKNGQPNYKPMPVREANGFKLFEVMPQVTVSLNDWSTIDRHALRECLRTRNADVLYAVLELADVNNARVDMSTVKRNSVQLNDIVTIIARKCESETKLLVASKRTILSLARYDNDSGLYLLVQHLLNDWKIMDGYRQIFIDSVMCVQLHDSTVNVPPENSSCAVTATLHSNSSHEHLHRSCNESNAASFHSSSFDNGENDSSKYHHNGLSVTSDSTGSNGLQDFDSSLGGEGPADKPQDGLQGAVSPQGRRGLVASKPPNILIYCGKVDSRRLFESLHQTFAQCLNPDRYTIYHLKHEAVTKTPWADNAALLLVASEKVYDGVDKEFVDYFLRGGLLMSFTSALDTHFINRRDIITSSRAPGASKPIMSSVRYAGWDSVTAICGRYSYDTQGSSLIRDVTVTQLATDSKTKNAVIVEMTHEESGGIAVLSQVNLEKDPSEMAISKEVFAALKHGNSVRFDVLRHLLASLGLDCDRPLISTALTPIYLLSETSSKREAFLTSVRPRLRNGGQLISSGYTTLVFDADANHPISSDATPVITEVQLGDKITSLFNEPAYRESLKTRVLGNTVMFADVVSTTMTLLGGLMYSVPHEVGLIAIARHQTQGQGRRDNLWLSPLGCAMFSLHVRVSIDSNLGSRVSFLQHMVALAVVLAVRGKPGYEMLDVRIKWPNDVYFSSSAKLGGVIVRSSVLSNMIHANIGCGINVTNKDPTICVNDLIRQHNNCIESSGQGDRLELFSVEEMIGRVVTELERLIDVFQSEGCEPVLDLYYKYWLHSRVEVEVGSRSGETGRVLGLDDFGYLRVLMSDGSTVTLQPDDNSFDMMRNLVIHKP